MNVTDIIGKAVNIRNYLQENCDDEINRIDDIQNRIIPPFDGFGKIKLIIIGQDPTIRNVERRSNITCTLNLNKGGSLKTYIEKICAPLDCSIDNVYATNLFKYFYTIPPADTLNILFKHLDKNLDLLKKEIEKFPDAKIITLGEPVLQLLTSENNKVKKYWCQSKGVQFSKCLAKNNKLERDFYPFIHIRSYKGFYKDNFYNYLDYIKNN
ncbi:MAG: uracil-DNA glycosylase family protein [Paludibacter sp.]|nr:uracil-DNA glycosylase family protein [Paludibacter sp.]